MDDRPTVGRSKLSITLNIALAGFVACIVVGLYLVVLPNKASGFDNLGNPADKFIEEIRSRRSSNKSARFDITDILSKYIAIGDELFKVKNFFSDAGFKDFPQKFEEHGKQEVVFVREPLTRTITSFFGFFDMVRVIVEFKNNKVTSIRGFVVYYAL